MERDENGDAIVTEVFSRGMRITRRHVYLKVFRCGSSYKFTGLDPVANDTYKGFFYNDQVQHLLVEVNRERAAEGAGPILLEDHDQVLEIILGRLALVDPIAGMTSQLKDQEGKKAIVVLDPAGMPMRPNMRPIIGRGGLHRVLGDTKGSIKKWEKNVRKKITKMQALGQEVDIVSMI